MGKWATLGLSFVVTAAIVVAATACGSKTVDGTGGAANGGAQNGAGQSDGSTSRTDGGRTGTDDESSESEGDAFPDPTYAPMFDPPTNPQATANSILGLWAGDEMDARLRFEASSVVIAFRCSGRAIGVKVAAQVTASTVRILESKQVAANGCSIEVAPATLPKCVGASTSECFAIDDTDLRIDDFFYLIWGPAYAGYADRNFIKLSD